MCGCGSGAHVCGCMCVHACGDLEVGFLVISSIAFLPYSLSQGFPVNPRTHKYGWIILTCSLLWGSLSSILQSRIIGKVPYLLGICIGSGDPDSSPLACQTEPSPYL